MKFYFFGFLYLFIFFGSIYGLFVSELNIGLGGDSTFNYVLAGSMKTFVCTFGLFLIAAIPACFVVTAVYNALLKGGS